MISKLSLAKIGAALGLGAGSAAAIHAATSIGNPTLPTSQQVAAGNTSTSTTLSNIQAEIQRLSNEALTLQSKLNAAKTQAANQLAQQSQSTTSTVSSPSTTAPITHGTTGASSAKSDDNGSSDSAKSGDGVGSKHSASDKTNTVSSKTDN